MREKLARARLLTIRNRLFSSMPLHVNQQVIYQHPARYRIVACGRRFGKTELAKRVVIDKAIDGEYWWYVLPTYKVALDTWHSLKELTTNIRSDINLTDREILFEGGGKIRIKSGSEPDDLRGAGLNGVVIDEAAFCSEDVWNVLRPALSDKLGKALLLSTPRGYNWFWSLFQKGQDPLMPDWKSWSMPSAANPQLRPEEIESARLEMPDMMFRQEYLAEFIEDAGVVFRNIDACIDDNVYVPQEGRRYVMGIDWGRVSDYTVLTVMEAETQTVVDVDRFTLDTWQVQRDRVVNMARKWNVESIIAEENSIGGVNIESLREFDLPIVGFAMTASSKPKLMDKLAGAFERAEIKIPRDRVLLNELRSMQMERKPSGHWTYSAPSGGHDDTVISLALALYGCTYGRIPIFFIT